MAQQCANQRKRRNVPPCVLVLCLVGSSGAQSRDRHAPCLGAPSYCVLSWLPLLPPSCSWRALCQLGLRCYSRARACRPRPSWRPPPCLWTWHLQPAWAAGARQPAAWPHCRPRTCACLRRRACPPTRPVTRPPPLQRQLLRRPCHLQEQQQQQRPSPPTDTSAPPALGPWVRAHPFLGSEAVPCCGAAPAASSAGGTKP